MPFIKKTHLHSSPNSLPSRSIFVGRTNELLFFVQHILKPEEPTHNVLSIWGQGGVGTTTLLQQFNYRSTQSNDVLSKELPIERGVRLRPTFTLHASG